MTDLSDSLTQLGVQTSSIFNLLTGINCICLPVQEKGPIPELFQSRGAKWFPGALSNDSYPSSADSLTTMSMPGQVYYPPANSALQIGIPAFSQNLHLGNGGGFQADPNCADAGQSRPYTNGMTQQNGVATTSGRSF